MNLGSTESIRFAGSGLPRPAPWILVVGFVLAGTASSARGQDGGIEVFAAETLFEHGTRVSLTWLYEDRGTLMSGSDEVSNPLDLERTEHRLVLGLDHGLHRDLTVSMLVPWVTQELESDLGDLDSAGLGDVALLAKYRPLRIDGPRRTFNVAVIGGLEVPTGETSARENGTLLPPPLQPGSGSWDPFAALTSNVGLDRWRFDAIAFYKLNTEGDQDWDRGNFLSLEADVGYRFLHTKYPGPTASAGLGVQWRYEGRTEQDGLELANSGRREVRLRPGVTWHPRPGIDVKLAADVPVWQDVNGTQLALDLRTFLAVGLRF